LNSAKNKKKLVMIRSTLFCVGTLDGSDEDKKQTLKVKYAFLMTLRDFP
jgi:hypothetical protein